LKNNIFKKPLCISESSSHSRNYSLFLPAIEGSYLIKKFNQINLDHRKVTGEKIITAGININNKDKPRCKKVKSKTKKIKNTIALSAYDTNMAP